MCITLGNCLFTCLFTVQADLLRMYGTHLWSEHQCTLSVVEIQVVRVHIVRVRVRIARVESITQALYFSNHLQSGDTVDVLFNQSESHFVRSKGHWPHHWRKIKAGQSDIKPQPTLECISVASAWLHAVKTTTITFTECLFFNVTIVP